MKTASSVELSADFSASVVPGEGTIDVESGSHRTSSPSTSSDLRSDGNSPVGSGPGRRDPDGRRLQLLIALATGTSAAHTVRISDASYLDVLPLPLRKGVGGERRLRQGEHAENGRPGFVAAEQDPHGRFVGRLHAHGAVELRLANLHVAEAEQRLTEASEGPLVSDAQLVGERSRIPGADDGVLLRDFPDPRVSSKIATRMPSTVPAIQERTPDAASSFRIGDGTVSSASAEPAPEVPGAIHRSASGPSNTWNPSVVASSAAAAFNLRSYRMASVIPRKKRTTMSAITG